MFVAVVALQFLGILWAANASGTALILALAVAMAAIYGQVTVGDIVIARFTADAWRGRLYAVRYFLTFVSAGIAVQIIAQLHKAGGFDLLMAVIAAIAAVLVAAVIGFATLVAGVEGAGARSAQAAQPAE